MTDEEEPGNWISIHEAIERIVKARGCSRRVARRMLVKSVQANKMPTRRTPIDPSPGGILEPDEAVERFNDDPTSVFMPLGYFIQRFDFTQDEIMGELKSGRLRTCADENTMFQTELMGRAPADRFHIDGQALRDWMTNPKTPPALLAKFANSMRKPS